MTEQTKLREYMINAFEIDHLGGQGGWITGGQEFKASLANMVKSRLYFKNTKISQVTTNGVQNTAFSVHSFRTLAQVVFSPSMLFLDPPILSPGSTDHLHKRTPAQVPPQGARAIHPIAYRIASLGHLKSNLNIMSKNVILSRPSPCLSKWANSAVPAPNLGVIPLPLPPTAD
ncbi:hypothetical protein AAY473_001048 [Plecturocebus cupreus]